MPQKIILIISGFNQRAVIAFLRTLKINNIPFIIIALSPDDTIFKTEYKQNVIFTRQSAPLDMADFVNCIKKIQAMNPLKEIIIAPSTEALNRFILRHKNTFEKMNCVIPLVDLALYENISDKRPFSELCKKYDIMVPAEYAELKDIVFPCVAKPTSHLSRKTCAALAPVFLGSSPNRVGRISI